MDGHVVLAMENDTERLVIDDRFAVRLQGNGTIYLMRGVTEEDHSLLQEMTAEGSVWMSGWLAIGPDVIEEVLRWMEWRVAQEVSA